MYKFRYNWHENTKFKFKLYQAIKISIVLRNLNLQGAGRQ